MPPSSRHILPSRSAGFVPPGRVWRPGWRRRVETPQEARRSCPTRRGQALLAATLTIKNSSGQAVPPVLREDDIGWADGEFPDEVEGAVAATSGLTGLNRSRYRSLMLNVPKRVGHRPGCHGGKQQYRVPRGVSRWRQASRAPRRSLQARDIGSAMSAMMLFGMLLLLSSV
jgi:hypothetical protein